MLSRIAESMFWIGRYVERAEDTARILDVATQLMLEDPAADVPHDCRTLLTVMGAAAPPGAEPDVGLVLDRLAHNRSSPESIAANLTAARESARRAREILSEPLWVTINTTHRGVASGYFRSLQSTRGFRWVREQAALINGTADATMTRDDSWQFLVLGRSIERADMTARLLSSAALFRGQPWSTTLRACGGHEAFLRAHRGLDSDVDAAEFLLLDRLFPRSIIHSINRAEQCLANLESADQRAGFHNDAHRLLGRMRADLEYRTFTDVITDLPGAMDRLQHTCAEATAAITRRYFAESEALAWRGTRDTREW
jgi:uncharacterized alpha-E superfamily protein